MRSLCLKNCVALLKDYLLSVDNVEPFFWIFHSAALQVVDGVWFFGNHDGVVDSRMWVGGYVTAVCDGGDVERLVGYVV